MVTSWGALLKDFDPVTASKETTSKLQRHHTKICDHVRQFRRLQICGAPSTRPPEIVAQCAIAIDCSSHNSAASKNELTHRFLRRRLQGEDQVGGKGHRASMFVVQLTRRLGHSRSLRLPAVHGASFTGSWTSSSFSLRVAGALNLTNTSKMEFGIYYEHDGSHGHASFAVSCPSNCFGQLKLILSFHKKPSLWVWTQA